MARVNIGVDPHYLTDQWLVAESVEITMISGGLRKNQYQIKGKIPDTFRLGTGHINFFKPKLYYLEKRLIAVNHEMVTRGFKPGTSSADLQGFPSHFYNDWSPTLEDSHILRNRLIEKLDNKPHIWRYKRTLLNPIADEFKALICNGPLFYV